MCPLECSQIVDARRTTHNDGRRKSNDPKSSPWAELRWTKNQQNNKQNKNTHPKSINKKQQQQQKNNA